MAGRIRITEDNIYPVLVAASLALSIVLSVVSAGFLSYRFALSVLAGGVLATANFCWMHAGLAAVLRIAAIADGSPTRFAVFRYLLRLAIVTLLLYVLIVKLRADVFGLLLGLSILVINLIVFTLYISTRKGG